MTGVQTCALPISTIGAIVRRHERQDGEHHEPGAGPASDVEVIVAHHDTVIESEDHVIVFAINKHMVEKVERLFQVGVGFV